MVAARRALPCAVPVLLLPLLRTEELPDAATEPTEADIIAFLGGAEVNSTSEPERYKETRGSLDLTQALEVKNRLFEPNTKCLDHDVKVDNAWMHPCDGEPHQKWYWEEDGSLHPLSDPTRCLEEDLGVFARANVWVRPCTGGDNQRWYWEGEYLKNHFSGMGQAEEIMCLDEDLAGGGYPGNVMVWPCHGTPNQWWYFSTTAEHMRIVEAAVDEYTGFDEEVEEARAEDDGGAEAKEEVAAKATGEAAATREEVGEPAGQVGEEAGAEGKEVSPSGAGAQEEAGEISVELRREVDAAGAGARAEVAQGPGVPEPVESGRASRDEV